MNHLPKYYLPVFFSVAIVIGLLLGVFITPGMKTGNDIMGNAAYQHFDKVDAVMNYVEQEYVDSVKVSDLVEMTITDMLQNLDPHSVYIPPRNVDEMNEPLIGQFSGIGIQFSIQSDTVTVITPISGGPSEQQGILAGDRIVSVEGENIAGVGITNNEVMKKLRGEKGSEVHIEIYRRRHHGLLPVTIKRDDIPITSLDVAYMVTKDCGLIKLSRFSRTTYDEFTKAVEDLKGQGMKELILDLRGNGGGFLESAIMLSDEFLPKGRKIVYTQGRARKRRDYSASDEGKVEKMPLVILIDEGSASASEIVSGAIQDNDRGVIVGRRSFGKGLVQEQSDWPDGSAIRLTIARYYTPSGRCIQRSYKKGTRQYYMDAYNAFNHSDSTSGDSIVHPDSLTYYTLSGRTVYGGGGIMPDIVVPVDTNHFSPYINTIRYFGIFRQFAFEYVDGHRDALLKIGSGDYKKFIDKFDVNTGCYRAFKKYVAEKDAPVPEDIIPAQLNYIKTILIAQIARNLYGDQGYYPVLFDSDSTVKAAIKAFDTPILKTKKKGHEPLDQ